MSKLSERVIRAQAAYNQRMAEKIERPRVPEGPITYSKVPWFALMNGQTYKGVGFADCELTCNKYAACKSFSFNAADKVCVTSDKEMGYDPDFIFYTKKHDAGKETAEYEAFPGMKFELGAQVISTGRSFEECEYMCSREKQGCAAFSYSTSKKVCMRTADPLHYDDKFNYYEKTGVRDGQRKELSEKKEVNQKSVKRKKWEKNFVRQSERDDLSLKKAVEETEETEREKKQTEADMENTKMQMKEKKQKLVITAKRRARFEALAKQKGVSAEQLEVEERETEAMKEVANKEAMKAGSGSAKVEAKIKAHELEVKETELVKEDTAASEEAASDQAAADDAAADEAKEQADEQEATNTAAVARTEEKGSALQQALAKAKVKKLEAEQTAAAEKAHAKEMAAKERDQKAALANEQVAAEQRSKKCLSEENAEIKKEICEKADADEVQKRADKEQERAGVEEELSEEKDSNEASVDLQAEAERVRELKKKELTSKHEARAQQIKQEAAQKKVIKKENWRKKVAFRKRKGQLAVDKKEEQATQMVEIKSKQQQIAELKVDMAHKQRVAQQDRINEQTTKKFNQVLREVTAKKEQKSMALKQQSAQQEKQAQAAKAAQAAAANAKLAQLAQERAAAEAAALKPMNKTNTTSIEMDPELEPEAEEAEEESFESAGGDEEEIAGGDDDEPVPLENAQEGGEGDAGEVTLLV